MAGKIPGRGVEVATGRGVRIRDYMRRRSDHRRLIGFRFSAVLFADHRSGWSALCVEFGLWWRQWTFYPIRWKNPPRENFRVVTLAEQVRETHSIDVRAISVAEEEDEPISE